MQLLSYLMNYLKEANKSGQKTHANYADNVWGKKWIHWGHFQSWDWYRCKYYWWISQDTYSYFSWPQDEVKKGKRQRRSESASTSPDIRCRENGVVGVKVGQDMAKDNHENLAEGERTETVDATSQEMKESNPPFLKYLQFKVFILANIFFNIKARGETSCFYEHNF